MLRPQSLQTLLRAGAPFQPIPRTSLSRQFTTALRLAAKKPLPRSPIPKQTPKPPSSTSPAPPAYQSFTSKLASRSTPTPLYIAPSHTLYIWSAYTGAGFCLSYAAFNYIANVASPPPGLATWIPIAFGGICFMMAAFGGWLILAPARLIKSITAHPVKSLVAHGPPSLRVDVELRKMFPLPFFPARVVSASPAELSLNHSIFVPPARPLSATERLAIARRQADEQDAERQKSILLAPFRHASQAFYRLFMTISRTWSREGFLKLGAKGQTYKLDVTGGWALDEGRALDRICKVQRS